MKLDVTKIWTSRSWEHRQILTCCAFSSDGRYLAAGGLDETVVVWDLQGDADARSLAAHRSWVSAVVFHPDGRRLFSADCHGVIHCWNVADAVATPLWSLASQRADSAAAADGPRSPHGWVRTLAIAPDGNLLAAGNGRGVRLLSADHGQLLREFLGHGDYIFSLAICPDKKSFVSGDLMGRVEQWDLAGDRMRTLDASILHTRGEDFLADVGGVRSLAFSPDGRWLACGGMTDAKSNTFCPGTPTVLVFDWTRGQLQHTLRTQHASDGPIHGLTFLSDGTLAGHAENLNGTSSLEFWRVEPPQSLHVLRRDSGFCLALHPEGLQLAAASIKPHGRGGNGRHSMPDQYVPHRGEVAVFNLFEKPA